MTEDLRARSPEGQTLKRRTVALGLGKVEGRAGSGEVTGNTKGTQAMETGKQVGEVQGLDVCRCQCMAGGECGRKMCTGAAALKRESEVAHG